MRAFSALVVAAGLMLSAGAASAQGPMPPARAARPPMSPQMQQARMDMRRICKPEYERLCPRGQGMDKTARRQCMKAHRRDASPACQQAQMHMKQIRRSERQH